MPSESLLFMVFLIFTGAAVFATLALYARQALIVSYIVLGVVMGPSLLGWVTDASLIKGVADIGIMFLLFLLGLNMHPQKLLRLLGSATIITGVSSLVFGALGMLANAGLENQQQHNRHNVLQQQDADHDLAGMPMMQHRGRQQLQTYDRAREHEPATDHERLDDGITQQIAGQHAESAENQRTYAGDDRGRAQQP